MVARVVYAAAGVRLIASQLVAKGLQVCLLAAATQTLPLSACAALAWISESRLTCLLLQAPDHLWGQT